MAALAWGLEASGCARDLARSSSSAIGCSPEAIEVFDISVGWSQSSWTAKCSGTTFYCSGESSAQCAPEMAEPGASVTSASALPSGPLDPANREPTEPHPSRVAPLPVSTPADVSADATETLHEPQSD